MKKRSIIFGSYDTAAHGWTLAQCHLTDPEKKTHRVEKPGGDGSWNLSTVLTEGVPRYNDRVLTVTLECSNGTRKEREKLIGELVNLLDGFEWRIVLPDFPDHYLIGEVRVGVDYSDLAHASVTITATCEPWLYSTRETVLTRTVTGQPQTIRIQNRGRRAIVPVLSARGAVRLVYNGHGIQLEEGTYEWPTLLLTPGWHNVEVSGSGALTITYREAVLR